MATPTRLGWRKIFSEQDETLLLEAETVVMAQVTEEEVGKISINDINTKFKRLGLPTHGVIEKKDLIGKAIGATQELANLPESQLKLMLAERGIDDQGCQERGDMGARLFAYEWSDGYTMKMVAMDGFVRNLTVSGLDYIPAKHFNFPESPRAIEVFDKAQSNFITKEQWFRTEMEKIRVPWEQGHIKIVVRRGQLLEDAFREYTKQSPSEMHKYFRYEFAGEPGIDAGGVAREFFSVTSDSCFDPTCGLFEYGGTDNVCYQISSSSGLANESHLEYFKFVGRLLGRALFERQQIGAHFIRPLYKHLLAWPIVEADMEFVDSQVSNSIRQLRECEDVASLCLDFTAAECVFGETHTVDLKPGGESIEVTNDNLEEYLELLLKRKTLGRVSPQLRQMLIGFYEVVPLVLLSVFDFNELELLLCGLPTISVEDWKANTQYKGEYTERGVNHPIIKMFWEVMNESTDEQRAKFLQFATGTARVPVQGFSALQGNDGNIKLFTIESVSLQNSVYPKAHTCFNRIELPMYSNKDEMKFRMAQAMQYSGVGFAME